ncbi:unnamed protein product [Prorocentrum cordatum]|uniref:Uncharacterized protein n=1 Tax=Prorocentrum cordatum TaxID=2364126 RepID=A0ABN9QR71_9DINO|nr:unnamed protein product [Polarella glacialis]
MRLLELQPESGEANLRVAELLLAAGHGAAMAAPYLKQVDASLREAGEVAGFSDERSLKFRACCAAAEVAMADEEHAAALAAAQEAVRLDASAPRGLVLLGRARLHVADYSAALRAFAAALAAAADAGDRRCQATVHALTAQARERLRQHAEALEEARSALAVEPGHVLARVVLATVLQQSGSLQEAERELQQALDCHPCDPGAQLQLGYCQLLGGRAEAISTLEELLRREGAPRSVLGAARVYLALALDAHQPPGHERSVEALLGEALGLHRNLARVWRDAEAGDADQAAAAVQRLRGICDLDLNTLQARQLLRLLALRAGRADLARALAAAHAQQARGAAHGARSRCPSSNPPSRWSCPEGPLLSLAASGASTPLLAGRGSPVPTGGPPTPQAAWPRSPSQPLGQGAPPHEASRRGRSREPQVWHRGSPVDASAARAPSLAGWRASREHSRERPTAASEGGDVLTIRMERADPSGGAVGRTAAGLRELCPGLPRLLAGAGGCDQANLRRRAPRGAAEGDLRAAAPAAPEARAAAGGLPAAPAAGGGHGARGGRLPVRPPLREGARPAAHTAAAAGDRLPRGRGRRVPALPARGAPRPEVHEHPAGRPGGEDLRPGPRAADGRRLDEDCPENRRRGRFPEVHGAGVLGCRSRQPDGEDGYLVHGMRAARAARRAAAVRQLHQHGPALRDDPRGEAAPSHPRVGSAVPGGAHTQLLRLRPELQADGGRAALRAVTAGGRVRRPWCAGGPAHAGPRLQVGRLPGCLRLLLSKKRQLNVHGFLLVFYIRASREGLDRHLYQTGRWRRKAVSISLLFGMLIY